jgi:hypothetical protein
MSFSRASLCLSLAVAASLSGDFAAGRLFDRHHEYFAGPRPTWLAPADFNEDGALDFAVGDWYDDRVWLMQGGGDGTFVLTGVVVPDPTQPFGDLTAVVSGDFNADGHADLVLSIEQPATTKEGPDTVQVFYGTGGMTFALGAAIPVGDAPVAMLADDLDGNGTLDLAVLDYLNGYVAVLRGLGQDGLSPAEFYFVTAEGLNIRAGDLNKDGRKDLVVGRLNPFSFLSILTGKADGTFDDEQQLPVSVPTVDGLLVEDLDVDGRDDLVVTNVETDQLVVMLNRTDPAGPLRFGDPVSYGIKSPSDLLAADLDRDGVLDLAAGGMASDAVTILPGRGNGLFGRGVTYRAGNGPQDIEAADLNGDGRLDLVTGGFGSGGISVLLGR